MAIVGNVKIGVTADTSGLSRGMVSARGSVRSFVGSVGTIATGMVAAQAAITAVSSAVRGFSRALVSIGKGAIQQAGKMQSLRVSFDTLLGSAEAGAAAVKSLRDLSVQTPFEPDDVFAAGKALLGFGVEADNLEGTLRTLTDVAGTSAIPLEELARIFGKAKATGRVFTQELDQMTERGIKIGPALAESLGVGTEELREMAGKGQIAFGDLQAAFIKATSEGGAFFEGAKKQAQTLPGLWSTVKGEISTSLETIGEGMIEAFDIKDAVSGAIAAMRNFREQHLGKVIEVLRRIPPVLIGVADVARKVLAVLHRPIAFVIKGISGIIEAFNTLVRVVAKVSDFIGLDKLASQMTRMADATDRTTATMTDFADKFQEFLDTPLKGRISEFWKDLTKNVEEAGDAGERMKITGERAGKALGDAAKGAKEIGKEITKAGDDLEGAVKKSVDAVGKMGGAFDRPHALEIESEASRPFDLSAVITRPFADAEAQVNQFGRAVKDARHSVRDLETSIRSMGDAAAQAWDGLEPPQIPNPDVSGAGRRVADAIASIRSEIELIPTPELDWNGLEYDIPDFDAGSASRRIGEAIARINAQLQDPLAGPDLREWERAQARLAGLPYPTPTLDELREKLSSPLPAPETAALDDLRDKLATSPYEFPAPSTANLDTWADYLERTAVTAGEKMAGHLDTWSEHLLSAARAAHAQLERGRDLITITATDVPTVSAGETVDMQATQAGLSREMFANIEKHTKREAQNSEKELEDNRRLYRLLEDSLNFQTVRIA